MDINIRIGALTETSSFRGGDAGRVRCISQGATGSRLIRLYGQRSLD